MGDGKPVMVRVEGSLSSTSGEVIHGWVLEGRGIAFKAEWDIAGDLRNGRLVECLAGFTGDPMNLYGVFMARSYQPPRLRTFIDFARRALSSSTDTHLR
jgi:DNA-binding transcriptional LysR family regulator